MALADLCLQMPQQSDYVLRLMEAFSGSAMALLLVITLLPEELNNRDLRLGENRRQQIVDEFEQTCPAILQVIQDILAKPENRANSDIRTRCFKSLQQWIRLGVSPATCLCTGVTNSLSPIPV